MSVTRSASDRSIAGAVKEKDLAPLPVVPGSGEAAAGHVMLGLTGALETQGVQAAQAACSSLAQLVSNVGSPPVQAVVVLALTAVWVSSPAAWIWAGAYLAVAVLVPLLHVVLLVKRGAVTDIHLRIREQRIRPLLVSVACAGTGWLVLGVSRAPHALIIVAAAIWLQTVIILTITLLWKISVHSAAAAGASTVAWVLFGTAVPLLVAVPLIAWSRVRLGRHTLAQTVAGSVLGFAVFLTAGFAILQW